ncbi:hypothetical protein Hanom_Chr14g01276981 [Helianthus anomalus]
MMNGIKCCLSISFFMATVVVTMDLDEATFLQASGGDFVTRKVKRQRDIRRNRKREEDMKIRN